MATAVVTGEVTNENPLAVTFDNTTYAVTRDLKNPSAAPGFGEYKEGNALYKEVNPGKNADGTDIPPTKEVVFTVNLAIPVIHTFGGIREVFGEQNDDEALSLLNSGIVSKLRTQVRAYYVQVNDAGDFIHADEGTISEEEAVEIVATPPKKQRLSPQARLMRAVKDSGLSIEDIQKFLAAMSE